ncbi:MAG: hypothetical protein NTV61_00205 [Candidatus Bathyarchaeota archaeon]|nr:hypothetical protein [Candidatus Bathyarchaeota archaeon]
MAKKFTQVDVIGLNVERLAGREAMEKVMEGRGELKPSVGDEELAVWVNGAVQRMDALLPEETRNGVMEECGRNCSEANRRAIDAGLAKRRKHKTEEAFIDAEVKAAKASSRLERGDGVLYQVYTPRGFGMKMRCFCALTRGLPEGETMSPTYCKCGESFARTYWRSVLGRPVEVKLLESGLTGSDVCRFEIRL